MTPAAIIQQAAADGVNLVLSDTGTLKATGDPAAVKRWLPLIRENKPVLLSELQAGNDTNEAEELRRLVPAVVRANEGTREEETEALAVALADSANSLQSYRLMSKGKPIGDWRELDALIYRYAKLTAMPAELLARLLDARKRMAPINIQADIDQFIAWIDKL